LDQIVANPEIFGHEIGDDIGTNDDRISSINSNGKDQSEGVAEKL
jgi:hypothetical protein